MTKKIIHDVITQEFDKLMEEIAAHERKASRTPKATQSRKQRSKVNPITLDKKEETESDNARRRRIFQTTELDRLGKGIVEKDEPELEERNKSHNADGEFSSEKNSTCDSLYFSDDSEPRKRKKGGSLSQPNKEYLPLKLPPSTDSSRKEYF